MPALLIAAWNVLIFAAQPKIDQIELYPRDIAIPMHYVINDSRTNKNRFYRLKATP